MQIEARAPMADLLGLVDNLSRRFEAHERGNLGVYYPAAAPLLTAAERQSLESATPAADTV